ncbi:MAG TPA: hypothetical protein VMV10_05800 [Pirellulales bacterium]|nr:hypothetical protein [Pirellulales bacterium]
MGLDLVELVIEVERTFDIKISDKDAGEITTVGELFEYVVAKTAGRQPACLSSFSFYRLRGALVAVAGISRKALRPRSELAPLFPDGRRRRDWRRLAKVTRLRLPELKRPLWLTILLAVLSLGIAGHALWLGWPRFGFRVAAFIAIGAWAATAFAACKLSAPWAIEFDAASRTLGGLTTTVMARNYAALCANRYQGTLAEIWATLVALVSEQLGVDPGRVTLEARFVDDFGAD